MRIAQATVVERRELAPDRSLLWLRAPAVSRAARPGQFVMVQVSPGLDPFLPRAFWIHRLRDGEEGEEFALLVDIAGRGSAILAGAVPGQTLQVVGPLGRGFTLAPGVRSLLLVGQGTGIAPLVWSADEETDRGRNVTLLLGADDAEHVYPSDLLRPEVEVAVATEDGSAGARGSVVGLLPEYTTWADQILLSGPDSLYGATAEALRAQFWRRPCQVLANAPLACGTGICGSCGVATRRKGVKLICRDGPAFELRDLF